MRPELTCTLPEIVGDGSDADLRSFLYGLFSVSHMLSGIRDALGSRLGITGAQFHLLMAVQDLSAEGSVGVKQLAGHLRVAPPNVTVEVAKLVKLGLLEKRPDPSDGRAVDIRLTRSGERGVRSIMPFLRDTNDRMFRDLDADMFRTALEAILTVRRNGEAVMAGDDPETAAPRTSA